jgi:hypothetical protein
VRAKCEKLGGEERRFLALRQRQRDEALDVGVVGDDRRRRVSVARQVVRVQPTVIERSPGIFGFVRSLGGQAHRSMYSALTRDAVPQTDAIDDLLDIALGDLPRGSVPLGAEARLLDNSAHDWRDNIMLAASALHFGSRLWIGSFISNILSNVRANIFKPISSVMWGMYDETPLRMRALIGDGERVSPEQVSLVVGTLPATSSTHGPAPKLEPAVCKIFQAAFSISIVVQVVSTQRYLVFRVPMLCPLQMADHGTGETIRNM